jgi:hypothetical protein
MHKRETEKQLRPTLFTRQRAARSLRRARECVRRDSAADICHIADAYSNAIDLADYADALRDVIGCCCIREDARRSSAQIERLSRRLFTRGGYGKGVKQHDDH